METPSSAVLEALQVTIAAIGCEMRPESAQVIALELGAYDEGRVLAALARCKLECRYRLSLADVIERMQDGYPLPEEAWALVPKSEDETVVLPQEILNAIPFELIANGDLTAARMAFRESYSRELAEARAQRREPRWLVSLGRDVAGRVKPIEDAVRLGRISTNLAQKLLPNMGPVDSNVARLIKHIGQVAL